MKQKPPPPPLPPPPPPDRVRAGQILAQWRGGSEETLIDLIADALAGERERVIKTFDCLLGGIQLEFRTALNAELGIAEESKDGTETTT
jgi:hypothetical protein